MNAASPPEAPALQLGASLIPAFAQPPSPPEDPPLTGSPTPATPADPASSPPSRPRPPSPPTGPASLRPAAPGSTRMETSSGGDTPAAKPTAKQTAELVAGLVTLLVIGAAAVASWRERHLRRPSKEQLSDFAAPVARILQRHTDAAWLNADLMDGITAGTVAGSYLAEGPLITRRSDVDAGVPHDLGETP